MASAKRINPETEVCELRLTRQEIFILHALLGCHIVGLGSDPAIHPRYHTHTIFQALSEVVGSNEPKPLVTREITLYLESQKVPCV